MPRALVLNATDQPLAVVPARRAVVLVLKEKAEIVASNGVVFRSERLELPVDGARPAENGAVEEAEPAGIAAR